MVPEFGGLSVFVGGFCGNADGVDFPLHQRAERIIHQAMSLHSLAPGKARRDDGQAEMAAAAAGAGMTRMAESSTIIRSVGARQASFSRMASMMLMTSGIPDGMDAP